MMRRTNDIGKQSLPAICAHWNKARSGFALRVKEALKIKSLSKLLRLFILRIWEDLCLRKVLQSYSAAICSASPS